LTISLRLLTLYDAASERVYPSPAVMAVVEFKSVRTPHVLDARTQKVQEHTQKAVQRSAAAVARSRDLIRKSKEVMARAQKRQTQ
jgi:hypothetical protein